MTNQSPERVAAEMIGECVNNGLRTTLGTSAMMLDAYQEIIRTAHADLHARVKELEAVAASHDNNWNRAFDAGYHARQQDLAFAAMTRGKLDQYNDAIGPASDHRVCLELVHGHAALAAEKEQSK